MKHISDFTQMTVKIDKDFKLSTVPWSYSQHVVEATQMQVESYPHPHTQIHTQCWQTVST